MSLLSPQQKQELAPFCIANADLELTPEDVVSLLKLAAQQRPLEETQDMFAQRRRTSKLLRTTSSTLGQRRRKESEQVQSRGYSWTLYAGILLNRILYSLEH